MTTALASADAITQEILGIAGDAKRDEYDAAFRGRLGAALIELNNCSQLLHELFAQAVSNIARGKTHNLLTYQQFILRQNPFAAVRVNLWPTLTKRGIHQDSESRLYSYGDVHDHNFNFVTIGHYGPGYETDIYEYDRSKIRGVVDEVVDLKFVRTETLERGKLIWFDSGRHVHVQYAPVSLSASINIILKNEKENTRPQYYFDLKAKKITGLTDNTISKQLNFMEICALFDNDLCRKVVTYFSESNNAMLAASARRILDQVS